MPGAADARAAAQKGDKQRQNVFEPMSGTRISNRLVSGAVVRARFDDRRHCAIKDLEKEIVGKHGFVGVVTEARIKVNGRGSKYALWTVSELRGGGASATVSVFGDAYAAHGEDEKKAIGFIWGVFDTKFYQSRSVSVDDGGQLMKIGAAADFGVCKATRKDGTPCTKAVNVSECKFCEFHVPKAIREVANAQRQMTGKRNANGDFKVGLQKYGASMQPTSARASHLQRPGEGLMNGGPAPSARAQAILKQSNAHLPRNAFKPKRTGEEFAARLHAKAPTTMALEEEDLDFEDDKEALATLARQHAASIAQTRQDASRAKQREVAERLRATGLTLTKPDPNDTSAKKPTTTVRAEPKPLPETLKAHGLQMATVQQLERKLKAEIARREALEKENEELRRQLAEARGAPASSFAPARPAMRDVSNNGTKSTSAPSTTARLFGHVAAPALKSRYAAEAEEEDVDQMMKNMDALEERDQLAAQLALKREVKVKVYHCTVCEKKTRFFDVATCREHRDSVKHVDSIMRYFRCKGCNRTNTSFDSLTPKHCEKSGCMSVAFERVTAADVTAAAKPRKEDLVAVEGNVANRDALAPRGVEHGFRLDTIHNSA